jgi:hypothetical protein
MPSTTALVANAIFRAMVFKIDLSELSHCLVELGFQFMTVLVVESLTSGRLESLLSLVVEIGTEIESIF